MSLKPVLCLKVSSKCYWIIGLLICLNFWLISKLKLQQDSQDNQQLQVSMVADKNPDKRNLVKPVSSEIEERSAEETLKNDNFEEKNIFNSELIDVNLGLFDESRKYKMFDNVIVGDKFVSLSIEYDVTLATQSSLDKLHWINHVIRMWSGPISVAIFVPEVEMDAARIYIETLRKCDRDLKDRVAFHFMFPYEKPPRTNLHKIATYHKMNDDDISVNVSRNELLSIARGENFCPDTNRLLKKIFLSKSFNTPSFQKWRVKYPFPQQHMRNLARKGSQTNYVFLTDIDIIPSPGLAKNLSRFLNTNTCRKCAYVITPYEVKSNAKFPRSKEELMKLVDSNQARLFHQKVFPQNQFATNSSMYERNQDDSVLHVSHEASYEVFYEPFYVSLDTTPPHDERFLGYGFTRNSQVMEMALDGWKFFVLSPAFAIHWGFQEKNQQTKLRKMQVNKNRQRYSIFEREVRAKYAARNSKGTKIPLKSNDKKNIYDKVGSKHQTNKNIRNKSDKRNKETLTENSSIRPNHLPTSNKGDENERRVTYKPIIEEYDFAGPQFGDNIV